MAQVRNKSEKGRKHNKPDRSTPSKVEQSPTQRKSSRESKKLLPGSWKQNLLIFFLAFIATMFLYSGDLHIGYFDLDDAGYVTDNSFIKSFSTSNLARIFSAPYFANYSPLHLLSYMIDYSIGGTDPFVYHLSNNIWAGMVSGFVFLSALALTRNRIVAIAATILFIVHPVHVEVIAWISSRKDLVAAAFILPSMLAYLKYRSADKNKTAWYILSVFLFILALGGKLSVASFPGVLLAIDLFMEKRPFAKSLPDKIPFLLAAVLFAIAVAGAQPPSGHHADPFRLSSIFVQNMALLSGFGAYVVYRVPPAESGVILDILSAVFLLALFILPYFLRRRFPLLVVLFYWLLFTFIPSQILSFIHPVTDRYLFLPSVAAAIMLSWIIFKSTMSGSKGAQLGSSIVLLIIAAFWTKNTLTYLSEWKDPRSVWYKAVTKSSDSQVYWGLGVRYQDLSDKLGTTPRGPRLTEDESIRMAQIIWKDNPKLPVLIAEFKQGKHNGPIEVEFQKYLRSLAMDALDQAAKTKTADRVMPVIYFRRGLILYDNGDHERARKEFFAAIEEAKRHSIVEAKEEFLVRSYNALGIVAWSEGNYKEALRWLTIAETEQKKYNGNWVPELEENYLKIKQITGTP